MDKNKNPSVSVVMSVYNGEKYLAEAIESILNQTFTDFEFIIINDGSTDRSRDIIISYKDPRIRLIDNKTNIGLTLSLNKGIADSLGKYIARMDSDDISLPVRLEKQYEFMEEHDDIAVCGTCAEIINDKGVTIGKFINPEFSEEIIINLFFNNPIAHPTVMMQKKMVLDVCGYDESFIRAQDYNLWIKLFLRGYDFYNLQEPLLIYRNHERSITSVDLQKQILSAEKSRSLLCENYLDGIYDFIINLIAQLFLNPSICRVTLSDLIMINRFFRHLNNKLITDKRIVDNAVLNNKYLLISDIINENNYSIITLLNRIKAHVFGFII